MSLQLVSGVCGLPDASVEAVVDGVEVVPHVVGALAQGGVDLAPQSLAGGAFLLRPGDVLLRVARPRLRDGDSGHGLTHTPT